ncbi:hypothetical protein MN116_001130 [Schistosoma mekongi]|uniref:WW domain-containing protein n=1 Tax=Schistosoma mekongi TaxID=38744 RepID=A0AAE2D965_SCHME|nr:hypothetical protein MN116_001130 [Schistosoma mekongi]
MSTNLWDDSDSDDNLPAEWEQAIQDDFVVYYNSETGCSTYSDPRLTSAVLTHSTKSNGSSQFKFDKFSGVDDG